MPNEHNSTVSRDRIFDHSIPREGNDCIPGASDLAAFHHLFGNFLQKLSVRDGIIPGPLVCRRTQSQLVSFGLDDETIELIIMPRYAERQRGPQIEPEALPDLFDERNRVPDLK